MPSFLDETNCFRSYYPSITNACKCKSINIRENRRGNHELTSRDTGNIGQTIQDEERKKHHRKEIRCATKSGVNLGAREG